MIPEKHYAVAVDGPSGAGKSTLAKAIAAKLGILYVDTGAIYRTVGYYMRLMGIGPKDQSAGRTSARRRPVRIDPAGAGDRYEL